MPKKALLMLGFGGPESFDQVRPFIEDVVRGRNVPAQRLEQVCEQYRLIGGKSPYNELIRNQEKALREIIAQGNISLPTYLGLLHTTPKIQETAACLASDGIEEVIVAIMAPHPASHSKYKTALESALPKGINIQYIEPWHTNPNFIGAAARKVENALAVINAPERKDARIIFTAHSIPQEISDQSGYAIEVKQSAELVAEALSWKNWRLAFQSRSGNPRDPWLGPDIGEAIIEAGNAFIKNVVVVPIGFTCDHTEVLFDLDIQAKEIASKAGLGFYRAGTVQDDAEFVNMLFYLACQKLSATAPCN